MHFLILTALRAEALPIIEVFRLRKDSKTHLYQNNNISLLITGVGRDKTKERLQNLHPIYSNFDQTIVVNMGIAGGNPDQTEIGELYRVNAIFDKKTKQSFIPDILCRHSLVELSLTTVDNSVNKNGDQFRGLVDMEGSVIFQQMSRYVSVHRLVFLKLVSDHMDIDDKLSLIHI